jgi:hypothetical protein
MLMQVHGGGGGGGGGPTSVVCVFSRTPADIDVRRIRRRRRSFNVGRVLGLNDPRASSVELS